MFCSLLFPLALVSGVLISCLWSIAACFSDCDWASAFLWADTAFIVFYGHFLICFLFCRKLIITMQPDLEVTGPTEEIIVASLALTTNLRDELDVFAFWDKLR